jgi:hypothetical protein
MQDLCATETAPEAREVSTSASELPSSEHTKQVPTRYAMESVVCAILSTPFLQKSTVVSTGSVEVLVDGCCPRASAAVRHPLSRQHRPSLSVNFRLRTAHAGNLKAAEANGEADCDDRVSNDAYSVACWLMKR